MHSPQQWSRRIRGQRESKGVAADGGDEKLRLRKACSEAISALY